MGNIADLIETYILQRLCNEETRCIILKRADIADAINCAPSQISYVLNTRFTIEKGFSVESRRGLGGYISIARMPLQNLVYHHLMEKVSDDFSKQDLHKLLNYMLRHKLIQHREAAIFLQTFNLIYDKLPNNDRGTLLRTLLGTLAEFETPPEAAAKK